MGFLQQACNKAMEAMFTDEFVAKETLRRMLERRGFDFSDAQLEEATRKWLSALEQGSHAAFTVDSPSPDVWIELGQHDVAVAAEDLERDVEAHLRSSILKTVEAVGPKLLRAIKKNAPRMLCNNRSSVLAFRAELRRQWHPVIDLLDTLILVAEHSRDEFMYELPEESRATGSPSVSDVSDVRIDRESLPEVYLWKAVLAIHVRACRTAKEISVLLSAGYADGANARWRSLHELAVVAMFLVERRKDLPERYLEHAVVQEYSRATEWRTTNRTVHSWEISARDLESLRRDRDAALAKYGDSFGKDYGWAAEELNVSRPTFGKLEESLNLKHWRPFYKLACDHVHASARALFQHDTDGREYLISDALASGLSNPVGATSASLALATVALMTIEPNVDRLATCEVLALLHEELQDLAAWAEGARG